MKKLLLLIAILLVLIGAYFLLQKPDHSKLDGMDISDRLFAVDDESEIYEIVIKNKAKPTIRLKRNGDGWVLNEFYKANKFVMLSILETLTKIDLKFIPPPQAQKNVDQQMERLGVSVEIYNEEGKKIRDYMVGTNTNNELGTYYRMKGAKKAYVMHFPYLEGSLRGRLVYDLIDLKDKMIFEENVDLITAVKVDYPKRKEHSFMLDRNEDVWTVKPLHAKSMTIEKPANQKIIKDFLSEFASIPSENIETENPRIVTVNQTVPFCIIDVTFASGMTKQVKLRPINDFLDPDSSTESLDNIQLVERFFVESNWRESYLLQKRQITKILRPYSYFFL